MYRTLVPSCLKLTTMVMTQTMGKIELKFSCFGLYGIIYYCIICRPYRTLNLYTLVNYQHVVPNGTYRKILNKSHRGDILIFANHTLS